jgi:hypothetical protein
MDGTIYENYFPEFKGRNFLVEERIYSNEFAQDIGRLQKSK